MRASILALALAGLLAACGGDREAAENKAPGTDAAGDAPRARPGLWAMTMSGEGLPGISIKTCVGEDSDGMEGMQGLSRDDCSEHRITRTAAGWTMHAVCTSADGMTSTIDQEFSGDPASRLTVNVRSTSVGGAAGHSGQTVTMTMEMTREGECPEGMGPGAVDTGSMIVDGSQMKR